MIRGPVDWRKASYEAMSFLEWQSIDGDQLEAELEQMIDAAY